MIYIPEFFEFYELVPIKTLYSLVDKEVEKWLLFDDRALWTLDQLRRRYGIMIVNSWHWEKEGRQYAGFRPSDWMGYDNLSQHKFGRAFDPKFMDLSAEEVREDILDNPHREEFKYITGLELNVSWLHFDIRSWDKHKNGIFIFDQ